jgi:CheY-like chemotaxis protein
MYRLAAMFSLAPKSTSNLCGISWSEFQRAASAALVFCAESGNLEPPATSFLYPFPPGICLATCQCPRPPCLFRQCRSKTIFGAGGRLNFVCRPGQATFFRRKESTLARGPDILLVDDNGIQAATRKAVLSRLGRGVTVAGNGEEALQVLDRTAQSGRQIGLVITDHLMPGMNGPEFVAELRERFPQLPVLVLSGLGEAEDEYRELDVTFRMKPLPPDELLRLVRSLLGEPIARTA